MKKGHFKGIITCIAGSSNGRTPPSGGGYLGSSPGPAARKSRLMEKFIKISKYHFVIIIAYLFITPITWYAKPGIFQYNFNSQNFSLVVAIIIFSLIGFWLYAHYFHVKEIKINLHDVLSRIPFLILYALFFAIPEEIIFRGIIQNYFQTLFNNTQLVVLAASLTFGAVHLPNGAIGVNPTKWNWQFAVIAFLGGLVFGVIYILTGTLLVSTLLHALFLFLLLMKATRD